MPGSMLKLKEKNSVFFINSPAFCCGALSMKLPEKL